ncbi:MAG: minor capsid protein [Turicibacter sp.]|nr:minor capsid protein [Turicibacter sp.]
MLDLVDRLLDAVEGFGLSLPVRVGVLDTADTLALILAGGGILQEFYDGVCIKRLNVDFNLKTNNHRQALENLNLLAGNLPLVADFPTRNGSYRFRGLKVTDLPYFQGMDEKGWTYYRLQIQVEIMAAK